MLSPQLRRQVFELWKMFWSSGMTNPLTAIEQITYLLFIKRLESLEADPNYTVAETWLDAVKVNRALELIASAGLILALGLQATDEEDKLTFVSAFRALRPHDDAMADFPLPEPL